jgi:hypothetical protein
MPAPSRHPIIWPVSTASGTFGNILGGVYRILGHVQGRQHPDGSNFDPIEDRGEVLGKAGAERCRPLVDIPRLVVKFGQ